MNTHHCPATSFLTVRWTIHHPQRWHRFYSCLTFKHYHRTTHRSNSDFNIGHICPCNLIAICFKYSKISIAWYWRNHRVREIWSYRTQNQCDPRDYRNSHENQRLLWFSKSISKYEISSKGELAVRLFVCANTIWYILIDVNYVVNGSMVESYAW